MISLTCRCGKQIKVADKYAGKKGRCPSCKEIIKIPESEPIEASANSKNNPVKTKGNVKGKLLSVNGNKINFTCPNCEETMTASLSKIGKSILCGICGVKVLVPNSGLDDKPPVKTDIIPEFKKESVIEDKGTQSIKLKAQTKKCPFCGEEILETAKKCKHCGEWITNSSHENTSPQNTTDVKPVFSKFTRGLIQFTVVLFIVFGSIIYFSGGEDENANEKGSSSRQSRQTTSKPSLSDEKKDVWLTAQIFVKRYLKSPSTASFGGTYYDVEYQNPEDCVQKMTGRNAGENEYVVAGWVDSQNSFGAVVRATFLVMLKHEADGSWTLLEEPIIEQR